MNRDTASIETLIRPQTGFLKINFSELWQYRELLYFFIWRDLKVRYKQTVMGCLWVVVQPLMATVIFTVFFGRFSQMQSADIPYPVSVCLGLLFWNYFSFSLNSTASSTLSNSKIIQKIYFPRLILPISSAATGCVDFCISLIIFIGISLCYHIVPSAWGLLWLVPLLLITFVSTLGLGAFLSAINVKYRDVVYVMPFFIQMLMFLTPVIYPVTILPERFQWILFLNPLSGVIETAKAAMFGNPMPYARLGISMITSVLVFVGGIIYFRKTESFFADII